MKSVKQIFENKPRQWGLRGDPYLWADLEDNLADTSTKITLEDFSTLLDETFRQIVDRDGVKGTGDMVRFAKYPQDGMSGGGISINWWTETGLPLLKSRYAELRNT